MNPKTAPKSRFSRAHLPKVTSEDGSAYIVTLMVIFVLTIAGLSLTVITQTEVMVGSSERTIQRIFYAADSGVGVATARALVYNDHQTTEYEVIEKRQNVDVGNSQPMIVTDSVEVSPFVPILSAPCNLCQINQGNEFFEINHAVTSTAIRTGLNPGAGAGDEIPLARKAVTAMVEVQPWRQNPDSFFIAPEELEKVEY